MPLRRQRRRRPPLPRRVARRTLTDRYDFSGGRTQQPDEVVEEFDLDWDSKRDRWNGYNPDDYSQQLEGGWNAVLYGRGGQRGADTHAAGAGTLDPTRVAKD